MGSKFGTLRELVSPSQVTEISSWAMSHLDKNKRHFECLIIILGFIACACRVADLLGDLQPVALLASQTGSKECADFHCRLSQPGARQKVATRTRVHCDTLRARHLVMRKLRSRGGLSLYSLQQQESSP